MVSLVFYLRDLPCVEVNSLKGYREVLGVYIFGRECDVPDLTNLRMAISSSSGKVQYPVCRNSAIFGK